MKVDGTGKTSGTQRTSKSGDSKSTGSTAFSSMVGGAAESAPAGGVSGLNAISQIDALLSLQEAGDGTEGAKRARERAEGLLDQLDRVRVGLLTGELSPDVLQNLSRMVNSHREKVMDPQLADILEEIDLRVQVELAKHQRV